MNITLPRNKESKLWSELLGGEGWEQFLGSVSPLSRSCPQPELLDLYTVNLHRIEKDVQRCDRSYWYFTAANLEKLRNIMCRWLRLGEWEGRCGSTGGEIGGRGGGVGER